MKKYILYLIVFLILTVLTTYKNSTIFNSKEKITITEIQKLAEKGNPEALNILSWIYFRGDKEFKIEKNNEKEFII